MRARAVVTLGLLLFAAQASPDAAAEVRGFGWEDHTGEHLNLLYDLRPAITYMYDALDESSPKARDATMKVYHHVWSPDGQTQLTQGAGERLYPHHRGLFYGFNKITYGDGKEADTWHCRLGEWQSHEKELSREVDVAGARHRVAIDWHGRDGDVFAHEQRQLSVQRRKYGDAEGWLIDFVSHLEPAGDFTVHLDGDPQHAGFQFRASPEVADKTAKQTYYLRTDGKGKAGGTINWEPAKPDSPDSKKAVNRPRSAMSFVVGGKRYTALYLDHPENPKPARYSERDYGRFGSYFVADVTQDKPLDVKYRVWVQDGEMTVDECKQLHEEFVD